MDLNQSGFGIEAEMTVECIKKDLRIVEVPIAYRARAVGAPTKLNPLEDGFKIGYTIYRLGKTYNPMLYLSLLGAAFVIAGRDHRRLRHDRLVQGDQPHTADGPDSAADHHGHTDIHFRIPERHDRTGTARDLTRATKTLSAQSTLIANHGGTMNTADV